jgi:hypothetical protein
MFNLDHKIVEWRRQMLAAGIKNSEVLDELENHLREDIERRMRSGVAGEQALQAAIQQIGRPAMLKAEFERVENGERKYMKRALIITAGIIGVLVGMAFVMPAVAQYHHEGAMKNEEPWLFLLGCLLTLGGCGAALRGFTASRAAK